MADSPLIRVTEAAAGHIRKVIAENAWPSHGLRLGLKDGGCSGYTYQIGFEPGPGEGDIVCEQDGVRVFIQPIHRPFLEGATLDYKRGKFEEGFDIDNPHAKKFCGCGESFDV